MLNERARELLSRPTCSAKQFAEMFGISLNAVYDAVDRGEVKATRIGKRIVIPTAPLRDMLLLDGSKPVDAPGIAA